MRASVVLGLAFCVLFVVVGLGGAYRFELEPYSYAENVCPKPPNGVDSIERQECFTRYGAMSGIDVARGWFILAGIFLAIAVVGSFLPAPEPPQIRIEPFEQPRSR